MLLTLGFSGVLAALIACWIKIKPATSRLRSVLFRGANILVSVLLILLVAALFYKDYASLFRNNKELVKSLSPLIALLPAGHGTPISDWQICRWCELEKTRTAIH